ncbi:hypothetical protein BDZ94DRAFT_1249449 [Collybia nuda]|uniref:Histone chaperone domain-containing protein n=1 Tax=Collybia nuda TaxID=64659 RepID=A0A9P5YDV9_9AGAR|nr:hypothetical protein BDZ94DRAFT_1249449 [Collybia nuda]
MSSNVTDPNNTTAVVADSTNNVTSPKDKGKGKSTAVADESMEEDEEEEEEDDDNEEEDDDEEEEEDFEEIDPSAILPTGRRTRGVRVDYSSEEALKKAGLQATDQDDDSDTDAMKE